MKIFHILQGVNNPSAGPTYSVGALAHHLSAKKNEVTVVALGGEPSQWLDRAGLKLFDGPSVKYGFAPFKALLYVRNELIKNPAVLHGHGLWRISNLFPLILSDPSPVKLVWSPRGMLSEWSWNYRAVLKRPFWYLLQRPSLRKVHCFHATADSEYHDIRRVGLTQPVAVIPNGVDVPDLNGISRKNKQLVFLSRIHPKKGLHLLVDAWREISRAFPEWELVIAGKLDSTYGKEIETRSRTSKIPRIRFLGEIVGNQKTQLLAGAQLFVLPTYSENFGMAIAEALACATPVITTTETPWRDINERKCGWCIKPDISELKEALSHAMSLSEAQRTEMGLMGREWVKCSYSWTRVADMMNEMYEWLLHGGAKPSFVYLK